MKQLLFFMTFFPYYIHAQNEDSNLWDKKVTEIIDQTARTSPKFTGGCVTLTGAGLATSIVVMSLEISKQKQKNEVFKDSFQTLIDRLKLKIDSLNIAAYVDLHSFDDYLAALRLPDSTEALKKAKKDKKHIALLKATISPLSAASLINRTLVLSSSATNLCHYSVISDMGAGSGELRAAVQAMLLLVKVNCMDLEEKEKADFLIKIRENESVANALYEKIYASVQKRIAQHK